MSRRVGCGLLVLNVMRDGEIRASIEFSGDERALRALNRWVRDWPQHSLNECDHAPFTCATFRQGATSHVDLAGVVRRGPPPEEPLCSACSLRKALGLPPLKDLRKKLRAEGGKR